MHDRTPSHHHITLFALLTLIMLSAVGAGVYDVITS